MGTPCPRFCCSLTVTWEVKDNFPSLVRSSQAFPNTLSFLNWNASWPSKWSRAANHLCYSWFWTASLWTNHFHTIANCSSYDHHNNITRIIKCYETKMIPFKSSFSYSDMHLSLCTFIIYGEVCAPFWLLSCYGRLASIVLFCLAIYLYPPFGRGKQHSFCNPRISKLRAKSCCADW